MAVCEWAKRIEEGLSSQAGQGGSRRGGCNGACALSSPEQGCTRRARAVYGLLGGFTPGYSLASSPVRVVESLPAQHSSERIRSSVADGSLGKISPLLLLVIMSGLSMGEGMVVWWVWLSASVSVCECEGCVYVCICDQEEWGMR